MKKTDNTSTTLILIGVMVSLLLAALDSTVVSTAMKPIIEDLGGMAYYCMAFYSLHALLNNGDINLWRYCGYLWS